MIEGDPFVSDNRRIEATLEPSFHPTVAGIAKAEANERNAFGTIGTGAVN
jgi:sulfatase maturation enzyme AslB (radical SAM superfamily)